MDVMWRSRKRNSEYIPQSNSCTGRHNRANENELRRVQSNDGKSPMAPFAKGGGPKDWGIFAANRHFYKRHKAVAKRSAQHDCAPTGV
jgi:hypothetical protein